MYQSPNDAAALGRARYVANLAKAIDDAQRAALGLGRDNREAMALFARLEAARAELESICSGGWASGRPDVPPKWIELLANRDRADPSGTL